MDSAPKVGGQLKLLGDSLTTYVVRLIVDALKKRTPFNTQLTCQLAVTEFSGVPEGNY